MNESESGGGCFNLAGFGFGVLLFFLGLTEIRAWIEHIICIGSVPAQIVRSCL